MSSRDWPVDVVEPFGCWLWRRHVDRDGYAIQWRGSTPIRMHRVIFEAEVGPIPPDHVIAHQCAVRRCVSPAHLEAVTQSENLRQRNWRYLVRRKTCAKGHALSDAMVLPRGRVCRTCVKDLAAKEGRGR